MKYCLYCYNELKANEVDFHASCSKKIFASTTAPDLPYTENDIHLLAKQIVESRISVTGVQPKLSLKISANKGEAKRFTIVGLWGNYILKPQTNNYPHLPELEDLTMHLARLAKINTVPHSLMRLKSGTLVYITKRLDRNGDVKIAMEDMCQLTERLTEHKYQSSYENIAKTLLKYSSNPILDVISFFEQVLFSFLTGNADMHLKNFSMIKTSDGAYVLMPAYDLIATILVNPLDKDEMALTLNGKKRKLQRSDFEIAFLKYGIDKMMIDRSFRNLAKAIPLWLAFIDKSFVPETMKIQYVKLIKERAERLEINF